MTLAPVAGTPADAAGGEVASASSERRSDMSPTEIRAGRLAILGGPLKRSARAALFPGVASGEPPAGFAAWRGTRGASRMRQHAAARGAPFLTLDRGLLRAPPQYGAASAVLSVTAVAAAGPHSAVDILSPDRVLASRGWETPALLERARVARRELVSSRIGGSWWGQQALPGGEGITLVDCQGIDPVWSEAACRSMFLAALAHSPPDKVIVLAPSDRRRSAKLFGAAIPRGCHVVTAPFDPWAAIERAARVYTIGGETGFLALLAGRPVDCFGDAFYSGWGITRDGPNLALRPYCRGVDEIFAGACLIATRCLDPYRHQPASFEDIAQILAEWRKIDEVNRRVAVCVGMSFWKRRRVADFFRSAAGTPAFRRTTRRALAAANTRPGDMIAVWASRAPNGFVAAAKDRKIPVLLVEDGFIRSVGLGSDFVPAASLVLDGRAMHYDPHVCSDLQDLLLRSEFDERLIGRARSLIQQLVARGITKYNLGDATLSLDAPRDRRRILVPGQVEDDLSVLLNSDKVRGNLDLLAHVRAANRDAFIVYKPHPDVDAGHRKGAIPDADAGAIADLIVRSVSTAALLGEIDELHTLTSLAGFEALLRRRRVVVYGRPFYAGWGLTADVTAIDRGRILSLEELVAGALILYPRYLDPQTRLPCPPEIIIERLDDPNLWRPGPLVVSRRLQGIFARRWNEVTARTPKPAEAADK